MIALMDKKLAKSTMQQTLSEIGKMGVKPFVVSNGIYNKIVLIGKTEGLEEKIRTLSGVVDIVTTTKPYKLGSREAKESDTTIRVGDITIGGNGVVVMAGPCSVESKDQILQIAKQIKKSGAHFLRGGAYKPRTAPYDFQGLEKVGLSFLKHAAHKSSMPIITEVLDPRDVEGVSTMTDIFQVGTRNMQNYSLLKELGRAKKPVVLKRGMWASYREFLLAAEYILAGGNSDVILCERGIRTHVQELRFNLDLNAVPYLKAESHLPVLVDPSHGTGRRDLVRAMSRAAIAAGADGLLIETHMNPNESISDADQTIDLDEFDTLIKEVKLIAQAVGRDLHE